MDGIDGVNKFSSRPIINEETIKQLKLVNIKTRAGKVAFLMLLGNDAPLGRMANGISKADKALKFVSRVLKERTEEEDK